MTMMMFLCFYSVFLSSYAFTEFILKHFVVLSLKGAVSIKFAC